MNFARFFSRALATIGLLVIGTVNVQGGSINVSTGLDASNNLILFGNLPDAHWTVDQPGGGIAPALVDAPPFPGFAGAWKANGPNSNWITIDPNSVGNGSVIPYTYYRTFTLTAAEAAVAQISGIWGIDDSGVLQLNGNTLSTLVNDYTASTPFSAGSGDFVVGTNVLTITMTSSDNFLEAVRLEGTVAPEPASMTLLGLGVAGMASYGWRRRKLAAA
jgi:PEP-CTERM motif